MANQPSELKLSELKKDLEVLVTPNLGGNATEKEILKALTAFFKLLEGIEVIKPVIEALSTAINTGLGDVAGALNEIAKHVENLEQQQGNKGPLQPNEAAEALTALQNALSTASTLSPSAKNVTAVATPFLKLLSQLLESVSFKEAAQDLKELAQQLETIGKAL
jgi:hypothetical protein